MPRKNKRKDEYRYHVPSVFDKGYKPECSGCAFAGCGSVCMTSDGQCLKQPPPKVGTREVGDAKADRRTDIAGKRC
jgi:hypothetical protein